MSEFATAVRAVVRSIKPGSVMTYKAVALAAGYPKAARAVANLLAKNYDQSIPCHRVICSNGSPGGYNRGGAEEKSRLLRMEGVTL
jgi:O-6-methylguanine DNA methyltransferase